jgi:hypothetical protein
MAATESRTKPEMEFQSADQVLAHKKNRRQP